MPFVKVVPEKLSQSVVRQIEQLILRGILRPGERLPSERDLAEELGVSQMTVSRIEKRVIKQLQKSAIENGTVIANENKKAKKK